MTTTKVDPRTRRTARTHTTDTTAAGLDEAHARYGGFDFPASLVGMLTALATTAILGGIVGAAIGAIGYQVGLENSADDISIAGLAGGIAVLFVAFAVGGWAAARVARYDGIRNGITAAIFAIILAAAAATAAWALGDEYDVLRNVDMPQFFSTDALTAAAIGSGIAAIAAMILGGAFGGLIGDRYHRRVDTVVADTATAATTEHWHDDSVHPVTRDVDADDLDRDRDRDLDDPTVHRDTRPTH